MPRARSKRFESEAELENPFLEFTLCLIAGILIAIQSALLMIVGGMLIPLELAGLVTGAAIFGMVSGCIVILGSSLIQLERRMIGGILALVFSALGLLVGGGFLAGSILGIIGGAFALRR